MSTFPSHPGRTGVHLDRLLAALLRASAPGCADPALVRLALSALASNPSLSDTRTALLSCAALPYAAARTLALAELGSCPVPAGPAAAAAAAAVMEAVLESPDAGTYPDWPDVPLTSARARLLEPLLTRVDVREDDVRHWARRGDPSGLPRMLAGGLTSADALQWLLEELLEAPGSDVLLRIAASPDVRPDTAVHALRLRARWALETSKGARPAVVGHGIVSAAPDHASERITGVVDAWLHTLGAEPLPLEMVALVGTVGLPDTSWPTFLRRLATSRTTLDIGNEPTDGHDPTGPGLAPLDLMDVDWRFLSGRLAKRLPAMDTHARTLLAQAFDETGILYAGAPAAETLGLRAPEPSLTWPTHMAPEPFAAARAHVLLARVGPDPHQWGLLAQLAASHDDDELPMADLVDALDALQATRSTAATVG